MATKFATFSSNQPSLPVTSIINGPDYSENLNVISFSFDGSRNALKRLENSKGSPRYSRKTIEGAAAFAARSLFKG